MPTLFQDVRYGLRSFTGNPGFAAVAIVTLALGIAVNSTIFSLVSTVLLSELPVAHPDRFTFVWGRNDPAGESRSLLSLPEAAALEAEAQSFEGVSHAIQDSYVLTGEHEPLRVQAMRVSHDFFNVWGVNTIAGRRFEPADDRPGAVPVVLLSHGFWERRFGGANVLGETVRLDGEMFSIVGVLSPKMEYGAISQIDVWTPTRRDPATASKHERIALVQALLKPGVSVERAQQEADTIAERLQGAFPESNRDWAFRIRPVSDELLDEEDKALVWVLTFCVAFVLLIACANVANMLMARATMRSKEIAVRLAMGARRRRLLRQFITEGFVLALFAGALGLLLTRGLLDVLVLVSSEEQWIYRSATIDDTVLFFTMSIALLTPFLFGLLPAVRASRPELIQSLKDGARSGAAPSGLRGRGLLVAGQVCLAVILMVVTGLLVRSVVELKQLDVGFEHRNLLAVQIELPEDSYGDEDAVRRFHRQLIARIEATPGVRATSVVSPVPLSLGGGRRNFRHVGEALPAEATSPTAYVTTVGAGYFETMGIPVLEGRELSPADDERAMPVVVVNEEAARQYWPDGDVVGKRIEMGDEGAASPAEVVGIVGNVFHYGDGLPGDVPQLYLSFAQHPLRRMSLVVRTETDPSALVAAMRGHVSAVDPESVIDEMWTMDERRSDLTESSNAVIVLFLILAFFALVMASMGIYGVMSFAVSQREHEIGIRIALGASDTDVLGMVVGQGLKLVAFGAAAGLVGAALFAGLLSSVLVGIGPRDPLTFVSVPILLALVALSANYFPARRATRIDPIETLRSE